MTSKVWNAVFRERFSERDSVNILRHSFSLFSKALISHFLRFPSFFHLGYISPSGSATSVREVRFANTARHKTLNR